VTLQEYTCTRSLRGQMKRSRRQLVRNNCLTSSGTQKFIPRYIGCVPVPSSRFYFADIGSFHTTGTCTFISSVPDMVRYRYGFGLQRGNFHMAIAYCTTTGISPKRSSRKKSEPLLVHYCHISCHLFLPATNCHDTSGTTTGSSTAAVATLVRGAFGQLSWRRFDRDGGFHLLDYDAFHSEEQSSANQQCRKPSISSLEYFPEYR